MPLSSPQRRKQIDVAEWNVTQLTKEDVLYVCVCVCKPWNDEANENGQRREKVSFLLLFFLMRLNISGQDDETEPMVSGKSAWGGGGMHCVAVIGVLWDWIFAVLWDSSHRPLFHVLYTGTVRCNASWNPEASYESSSHKATAIRFFDSHPISWRCSASYDSANILYSMFI